MSIREYQMKWGNTPTYYREDRESGEETLTQDGSGASRILYTAWKTRVQASKDFLGYTDLVDGQDGFYYPSRAIPNYHPDYVIKPFPNNAAGMNISTGVLYADSINHKGYCPDGVNRKGSSTDISGGAAGTFLESQMTVKYVSYPYTILQDQDIAELGGEIGGITTLAVDESLCLRYVWGILQPSPKYQTIPAKDTLAWSFDNAPVTTTQTFLLAEGDFLLKWFNIPLALYDRPLIESLIGRTNDSPFGHVLAPNGVFAKGTLVFIMETVEPYRRTTGEIYLNINYRFKYYPNGANKFWRYNAPTTGATHVGGGTEVGRGDNYYFATRRINIGLGEGNRAVPENALDTIPTTDGVPNVNVLIFPYGSYRNLFRARIDPLITPIPGQLSI